MSQSRRLRRANGMKSSAVRKALESGTPLNSLYALIPETRRKALYRFVRCFGVDPTRLYEAMRNEQNTKQK